MAVPAFHAVGTSATATAAAASFPWPAGHAVGDIGLLVVEASGTDPTLAAPAGWGYVLPPVVDVATVAGSKFMVFWKRATSTAEAAVSLTATDHLVGRISTWRGAVASGWPFDNIASSVKTTASTAVTLPAVTTGTIDTLVILIAGRPNDLASTTSFGLPTNAALAGITERFEAGSISGNGGGFSVCSGTKATVGTTGTTAITATVSTTNVCITIALASENPALSAFSGGVVGSLLIPEPVSNFETLVASGVKLTDYGVTWGRWRDTSGNGNDLTEPVEAELPFADSLAGLKNGFLYDPAQSTGGGGASTLFYLAMSFDCSASVYYGTLFTDVLGINTGFALEHNADEPLDLRFSAGTGSARVVAALSSGIALYTGFNGRILLEALYDGTKIYLRLNRGTPATAYVPSVSPGSSTYTLAGNNADVDSFGMKVFGAVVIKNALPSDAVRSKIADQLAAKGQIAIAAYVPEPLPMIPAATYKALWSWNESDFATSQSRQALITFATSRNITTIYQNAQGAVVNNQAALTALIDLARASNIDVELLFGDASWTYTANHSQALSLVSTSNAYIAGLTNKPVGYHFDIEPHTLGAPWTADPVGLGGQLINLYVQLLATRSPSVRLNGDIALGYKDVSITRSSVTKTLSQWLVDYTDVLTIMAYRDFATGLDSITFHADHPVTYATSVGKKVYAGVETQNLGEPEKVSFFEEGPAVLDTELAAVRTYYNATSGFGGVAIHDYVNYNLPPFSGVTASLSATEAGQDTFAGTGALVASGVAGAMAVTEAGADSFASAGAVRIAGALAVTETGADTFTASGAVRMAGALAASEAGSDTFAASGGLIAGGSFAAIESGGDSFASAGAVLVAGALAATEAGLDTFASAGAVLVAGAMSASESAVSDSIVGAGSLKVQGALAVTESGTDTFAAATSFIVTGALAATESGADTFASGGAYVPSGSLSVTETGTDTFAAASALKVQGALAAAEEFGDTANGTGTNNPAPVIGTLSANEAGADSFAAGGAVKVAGAMSATEQSADVFTATSGAIVAGTFSAAETGSDTFAASGALVVLPANNGALSATETGSDSFAVIAMLRISGMAFINESSTDTFAATGAVVSGGTMAAQETSQDAFLGSGGALVQGALAAAEEGQDAAVISGTLNRIGVMAVTEGTQDYFTGVGFTKVQGALAAAETGQDAFSAAVNQVTGGSLVVTEEGQDGFMASGAVLFTGAMMAVETGQDGAAIAGSARVIGLMIVVEAGRDTISASGTHTINQGHPAAGALSGSSGYDGRGRRPEKQDYMRPANVQFHNRRRRNL